jgi:hypothetical protein
MRRTLAAVLAAGLVGVGGCEPRDDAAMSQKVATARADIARLREAAETLVRKSGRCPTGQEVERAIDPWGKPYVVLCPGQKGHAADVVSKGRDGDIGTTDDIRSWDQPR